MVVLGIETSCDETAAAIYDKNELRANIVASQEIHGKFGGVVPELASREHIRLIIPIIKKALLAANLSLGDIEGVAVTQGPGLVGSLLIGINTAKAMAFSLNVPIIGVNHIEGHIFAVNLSEDINPPYISLVISGGHTELIFVKDFGEYEVLGKTLDDAAGEAFDKVAKMLELGYPGGPIIDKLAKKGNPKFVDFPRALMKDENLNFSFSGLKTAVLYYLKSLSVEDRNRHKADIVASFQKALADVLIYKTILAAKLKNVDQIVLAGGVARNSYLRNSFQQISQNKQLKLFVPDPKFCTDNAAMIALVGHHKLISGISSDYQMAPIAGLKLL